MPTNSFPLRLVALTTLLVALFSTNCQSQARGKTGDPSVAPTPAMHFGRLVTVYGLRSRNGNTVRELFRTDMLVGRTLPADGAKPLYQSIPSNPDTLQGRLLIAREIDSEEFRAAVDRLDDGVSKLVPGGSSTVPRNAAIRLTFPVGTKLDPAKCRSATRLLNLGENATTIPTRIAAHGNTCIVDPVLFGTNARQRRLRNLNGMPVSKDQKSPNIRLHVDLGKLLSATRGATTFHRDFRAAGRLKDAEPPRLLGEMTVYLERVQELDAKTRLLTIFRGGVDQDFDQGDILRVHGSSSKVPTAALEILQDARDPLGVRSTRRVRVLVRVVRGPKGGDLLERMDPSNLDGFPKKPGKARDAFVRKNGPRIVLVTAFDPSRGDNPSNFIRFSKARISDTKRNREDIPPMAGCHVRFSKSIDLASLKTLDTIYFSDVARWTPGKPRLLHVIPSRLSSEDETGTSFRLQPPLGFALTPAMRRAALADRKKPHRKRRSHYFLNLVGGKAGIKDHSGLPLANRMTLGFSLDPKAADNLVAHRVFAFGKGR